MCGICGILSRQNKEAIHNNTLRRMTDSIMSRGPDEEGFYIGSHVGMGVRRLAIIDIKGGQQPVCNEEKTIYATLNGELYNYLELKRKLTNSHCFNSNVDTEIIPHLYEEYGDNFVELINGMFGIALWDERAEKFLLYRDRIGIKPLYYYCDENYFIWGSELKSILASGLVEKKIDSNAVELFFRLGYVPAPYSIFQGIKKLEPGRYISVLDNKVEIKTYWSIDMFSASENIQPDINDAKEELLMLLKESIKYRLVSDVPIGAFLSGGVDSSLIVGIMSEIKTGKVDTFTACFREKEYDETKYADKVSLIFNTKSHKHTVHPDSDTILKKILPYFDEPFADKSSIPAYYISKLARRNVTVALSGDGGDELFGGYLKYRTMKSADMYHRSGSTLKKMISLLQHIPGKSGKRVQNAILFGKMDPVTRFEALSEIISLVESKRMLKTNLTNDDKVLEKIFKSKINTEQCFNNWMGLDIKTFLVDDVLTKVDRMSMSNSLEVRVPFLDHRIVEYAIRLPSNLKLNGFQGKFILKKIAEDYIPKSIVYRKKHSWKVPTTSWLKGDLSDYLLEKISLLSSLGDILNIDYIRHLILEHRMNKYDHATLLWTTLSFIVWYEKWYGYK